MSTPLFRALILVTLGVGAACAPRVRVTNVAPPTAEKFAELWQAPHDLTSRGAFVVLWSLPWGGVLALTGWLPRAPAIAIGLTVAVTAVSAYPTCDIVNVAHHVIPVLIGLCAGLLVAALHAAGRPDEVPAGEPAPPQ